MAIEFTADFLLASLLSRRAAVSWQDINVATGEIYSSFNQKVNVYIHSHGQAILGAVQGFPDVLRSLGDEGVSRAEPHDPRFFEKEFILKYLGRDLDHSVALRAYEAVQRAISSQ